MDGCNVMYRWGGVLLLFVTPVAFAQQAFAQQPPPLPDEPAPLIKEGAEDFPLSFNEQPVTLREVRHLALQQNKTLAVTRYFQEETATDILAAQGRFDTTMGVGIFGGETDRQNRSIVQSFGTVTNVQEEFFMRPLGENEFFLTQRNTTGGITRIAFDTAYSNLDPAGLGVFVNPAWESRLLFRYEQPLLKDAGWEINTAPIVIARSRTDQSIFLFQQEVQKLLRDAEYAYWDLELAHQLVGIFQDFEVSARSTLIREQKRLELGTGTAPNVAQAEERYSNGQVRVVNSMGLVTLAMLKLSQLAGINPREGQDLVPVDDASLGRPYEELPRAMDSALGRPEILAQAAALRAAEQATLVAANGLQPNLSLVADYAATGLEDGFVASVDTLADFQYHEWSVGVRYTRTICQFAERANLQKAKLGLSRQLARLEQLEQQALYEVADAYERVQFTTATLRLHKQRIEAAQREVEARERLYEDGRGTLTFLLESQDRLIAARVDSRVAWRDYQKAVTDLKFASGTILDDDIIIEP